MSNTIDYINIKEYDIISFDIYDTLVERIIFKPTDVFKLIEKIDTKYSSFSKYRIIAERKARKNKKEEVTLDDIYLELSKYYSKIDLTNIKKEELKIEKQISFPREDVKRIYDKCIKEKKRVILVSDMYLPIEEITDILHKCGYKKFEKLYLSSQIGKTKSRGDLFKYVLDDLKIESKRIIHIGDNKHSDCKKPNEYAINSFLVRSNKKIFDKNIMINILKNLVTYRFKYENSNSMKMLGYIAFGPILYSYSKWVHKIFLRNKLEKIFFLSRDGYTMKAAYDLLYPEEKSVYMLASRRALSVPIITREIDFKELCRLLNINENISKRILLKKFGINLEAVDNANIMNSVLNIKSDEANDTYNEFKEAILNNAKNESDSLYEYLKKIGFSGKVGIVDIGWFGNMQNYLRIFCKKHCIKVDITGMYIGKKTSRTDINMKGFLFDENNNPDIKTAIDSMNSLFESCFLANHGSLSSYLCGGLFEKYEYNENELNSIRDFQKGALCFVEDISRMGLIDIINLSDRESFVLFKKHFCYPSLYVAKTFGDLPFYDTELTHIAKPKSIAYYLIHFNKFLIDFSRCRWKIGFLTRLTKVGFVWFFLYKSYYGLMKSKKNDK